MLINHNRAGSSKGYVTDSNIIITTMGSLLHDNTVMLLFLCFLADFCSGDSNAKVQWYRTARDTADRLTQQPNITMGMDFASDQVVTFKRSIKYQNITGFGGAFTDSAATIFSRLSPTLQSQVLDMYFSSDGLRYNMARLPIGSCDFSLENYNYASMSGDVNLTQFSINHDKTHIIPMIRLANATISKWSGDALNIVASPWSPPGWFKENNNPYCPRGCDQCVLVDKYKDTWALYFSKFISAYNTEGINIWGVTIQNEPEYCPGDYECMHFTPETERDFLKDHLGPRLSTDHPDVNILIYDHNKDHVVQWVQTIFSDPEAAKYAWGTAVHWYSGDLFDNVNTAHKMFPQKPILASEATEVREKNPANPAWGKGEHYAHDIIGDINNWVVGFIDWNLILDIQGGPNHKGQGECEGSQKCGSDAMLLADTDKQVIHPQVFYYYMGHFSKFTPRGSTRIFSSVVNSSLESVVFLTPIGDVVVVVMNRGDSAISFKLFDADEQKAVKVTALKHSIQTFIL